MGYDSRSESIFLDADGDLIGASGPHFIHMLRDLATNPTANPQIRGDWETIKDWLKCDEHGLTAHHDQMISLGWQAYLYLGVAPSDALQPAFDSISAKYKQAGRHPGAIPPKSVLAVFDRLMATDDEIKQRRARLQQPKLREPAPTAVQGKIALRATQRLFGTHEGIRRLSIVVSAIWLAGWMVRAGMLQADLWETSCYWAWSCSDQIHSIWVAIGLGIAGPFAIAAGLRLARWVQSGFGQQQI